MELEELQSVWSDMSDQLEKQKKLTHKIIMEMTQEKYRNKFQKFLNYEGLGAIVCLGAAIFMLLNFQKLDTWYFILLGGFTLVFLIGLPVLVLRALYKIKNINILEGNYKDTLVNYARTRNQLLFAQRLGINFSYIFAVISIPLAGKLFNDKDVFLESTTWLWYVPVLLVMLFFFSRWGYKCYVGATDNAEALIKDLQ